MKQPFYKTALYFRLSRDDDNKGESNSISTQRLILNEYAKSKNLLVYDEYVDDGYSGTNFLRPAFERMIGDIEAGKVNCVITKDLSRLGRNYLLTGQYIEMYFPAKGVRFIAVNDGVDSNQNQDNDFTPFKNIINEWYAKDTSQKVKQGLNAKFLAGARYGSYAPIGYKKDPEKVGHLLIDEETRWIIEKIYNLASQGMGAAKITKKLIEEEVSTPAWLNFQRYGTFSHVFDGHPKTKRFAWSVGQVKHILKDETYIGNSVHNRQRHVSFKSRVKVRNPKEDWLIIENTQEAIIQKDVFNRIQSQIDSRRRQQKDQTTQIFAGLVKCSDCGWAMRYGRNTHAKTSYSYFVCTKYSQMGKINCYSHYVRYDVLYAYVLSRLQKLICEANGDEEKMLEKLLKKSDNQHNANNKRAISDIKRAEKRQKELNNLFTRLYEDRVVETITESNFLMLSQKYQHEQAELEERLEIAKSQLANAKEEVSGAEKWLSCIRKYTTPSELTAEMLNALIEKIVIHNSGIDSNGNKEQEIEIFYRFVGKID